MNKDEICKAELSEMENLLAVCISFDNNDKKGGRIRIMKTVLRAYSCLKILRP